jgi:hypothetical protein
VGLEPTLQGPPSCVRRLSGLFESLLYPPRIRLVAII